MRTPGKMNGFSEALSGPEIRKSLSLFPGKACDIGTSDGGFIWMAPLSGNKLTYVMRFSGHCSGGH
jgi:hypothetical protein